METQESNTMRVLMLPWLAHGHISPFLELAKKLTTRNCTIYICSTPINLSSIQKRITQQHSLSIKLVELHLPTSPDLPPHRHTTTGLPPRLMPALKSAYKTATPQFSTILKTLSPHLLIHDFNQPWAAAIAADHHIPAVQFITTSAAFASSVVHRFKRPGIEYPFPEIQLRGFHDAQLRKMMDQAKASREAANHESRPLEATEKSCGFTLYNSFRELEGKYIDYLSSLSDTKIIPIGPIIQEVVDGTEETEVLNWLDSKNDSSTVFVSFGSEYFLSKEELEEVAHGLEISEVNFIWVVRFPLGEKTTRTEEALPKGFVDRVGERGMVVEGWAPQARILAHSSVGGFVSHCGWNSVLESLKFGVPIIAMPMQLDQPSNARLMEEVGVGVEVGREEDGRLDRHEIAKSIRKVVVEKNGEGIRVKSREISEIIKLRAEKGVDGLLEEFARHCMEKN